MPRQIKYLHIMRGELKFSVTLIEMIQNEENRLNGGEHFFIFHNGEIYKQLSQRFDNILFFKAKRQKFAVAEIINEYGGKADWLFIHGFEDMHSVHKIKRKYYKKTIWRTWGGDNGIKVYGNFAKRAARRLYNRFVFVPFARGIYAIGIANIVDEMAVDKLIGKGRQRYFPVYYHTGRDKPQEGTAKCSFVDPEKLNVMIGHSAYGDDRHMEMIDLVKKFKGENMQLYIPLSYGKEDIRQSVGAYARAQFGAAVTVLDEFMPKEEYLSLLQAMDIAILPGKTSYALGNIVVYLCCGKTLYLSKGGILAQAFEKCGIPHKFAEDIEDMDFKAFSSLCTGVSNKLAPTGENVGVEMWQSLLEALNKHNDEGLKGQ